MNKNKSLYMKKEAMIMLLLQQDILKKSRFMRKKIYETYRKKNSKKTGITDTEKVFSALSQ